MKEHTMTEEEHPALPRPTDDLCIVEPDRSGDRVKGSIVVPDAYQAIVANDQRTIVKTSDQWARGVVRAVGPGARREHDGEPLQGRTPCDVSDGDLVIYKRAEASPVGHPFGDMVYVREVSILGVVTDDGGAT